MKNFRFATGPVFAAGLTLLLALLSACATVAPTQDEIIAQRAQARWDALLARDYAKAYSYYSPGFRAEATATDLEIKVRMQRVKWEDAKYQGHRCEADICTVNVKLYYQVAQPVPGVSSWAGFDQTQEQWVKIGGEWWFVPPKG